jgi:hypothetical protein
MRRRASFFFLVLLAACDRKPKSTPPLAMPHANATAKPDASVEKPSDAAARTTAEECVRTPCLATRATIAVTPYGTSNVAAVGDDVWFLRFGEPALVKNGAADKQDVVLGDVRVTADTWMSQMLVEDDTAYFATSNGVVSWNRKTSALTTLTQEDQRTS